MRSRPQPTLSTPAPESAPTPTAAADDQLQQLEAKSLEYLEGWQRSRADYENLQKRLVGQLADATAAGKDAVLRELLPVVDAFETALSTLPRPWNAHPWTEGLARIHGALKSLLGSAGVTPVGETGIPFDAEHHESVAAEPSELPVGTVTTVLAKGYRRNGRLLRPTKVKVSAGPPARPES